ncbi:MAG: ATP-binding protein [Deltaproteobacteria bacterium]|nr:ATP-binding protein [Candidatus Zymogenaceae bacterium]
MKLEKLIISNFRAFNGTHEISFNDLTVFIGKNDIGKSSILDALEIFFNSGKIDSSDISIHPSPKDNTTSSIGCVFSKLPEEIILDANAKTSLKEEYILNKDGFLEIHKSFNFSSAKNPKAKIIAKAYHPTEETFKVLLHKKNADLKKLAEEKDIPSNVDKRSNVELRKFLWSTIDDLKFDNEDIDLEKEDARKLWDQISKKLPLFALFKTDRPSTDEDSEVQDPMKLAVKQVISEIENELETIKERIKEETLDVATRTVEKLKEIDSTLAEELKPTFKEEPKWSNIFKLSLTDENQIPINKRGSGVRRLILISFLQAEAERKRSSENKDNLILAIEEPETSQHPDNQKLLIEALEQLSQKEGYQIITTTHVPALAGLVPIRSIRYIEKAPDNIRQIQTGTDDTVLEKVSNSLGVLADRRVKAIICVEGPSDVKYLKCFSKILNKKDNETPNLENTNEVVFIPMGGRTLQDWVNDKYLKPFGLPMYYIFDRGDENKYEEQANNINSDQDKSIAYITNEREIENYLHSSAIEKAIGVRIEITDTNKVAEELAKHIHCSAPNAKEWKNLSPEEIKKKTTRCKKRLCNEVLPFITLKMIEERNAIEEISMWLEPLK